ncbi:glycosyltransferase family 39 protein [Thermosulfurimonas sp. F29]|uniref:ArnT family glycosyltransferase n=1 Tax=Thermosulfurimonas sp. F29 TaxID=2867247 RepID=UPI001C82E4C8|nr:glycosyltransferase family 39 protein [Thermosulfurimonas sp. F29]MBX6422831.1 glycosyltransferase family 39 protein [Thermosulfurimonas sp. F29]
MKPSLKLLFVLALFMGLWFQGTRPLMGRDEHRYPQIAHEMLIRREFIVPYWQGHPHLTKPPLFYWFLAAGEALFGNHPWGIRVPNAVSYAVTSWAVGACGKILFGEAGEIAGLLYACTLTPFVAANIVTPDTLLIMWEVLAAWAFFRRSILVWIFWALAFMTKGTAVLPVMTPFVYYGWISRRNWRGLLFGIILFSTVAFPWYLYIQFKFPWFWKLFLREQVTGRLFFNYYHRNSAWYAPLYLYLPLLTLGALPGFYFLVKDRDVLPEMWKHSRRFRLVAGWYLLPLAVFWLARSRLPLYILPLFAPFVLVVTALRMRKRPFPGKPFWVSWILGLLLLKAGLSWWLKIHGIFPQ